MSFKTAIFGKKNDKPFAFVESKNLFIIRFNIIVDPLASIYAIEALEPYLSHIVLFKSFPESFVFLFKIINTTEPEKLRDDIKQVCRQERPTEMAYIGTVFEFAETGIYQIYTGNIFIKFKKEATADYIEQVRTRFRLTEKRGLKFAANSFFWECPPDVGREIFDLANEMLAIKDVEYCHPELVAHTESLPNDKMVDISPQGDNTWFLEKTGVFEAWKTSRGKGVTICVIDDGLEFKHPAFSAPGKILAPKDMHDKLGVRLPLHQFDERHGTACASVATSADPNAYGVAPDAQLMPVRATSLGSILQSEAFYWAVQHGADIISCSWGPPDGSISNDKDNDTEYPIPAHTDLAIKYAAKYGRNGKGCVIVFAAGNGNETFKKDGYAAHPDVLAIGAANKDLLPTIYSDYGAPMLCCFPSGDYTCVDNKYETNGGLRVADVVGKKGFSEDSYYDYFTGTSASCPGVAGIAALILSVNPGLMASEVREIIQCSCHKIGDLSLYTDNYSQRFGYGLIQANLALANISNIKKSHKMKALSLHIGINLVDKNYYGVHVPALAGCVNDMNNMKDLATQLSFTTKSLINEQATLDNIEREIKLLGTQLDAGGLLLITYAGHGAPLKNEDSNEAEKTDQAWVTYNGFLLDDKLNEIFSLLPEGIRVLVISDSCFSGSMLRLFDLEPKFPEFTTKRSIDETTARQILIDNKQTIEGIRGAVLPSDKMTPRASVKLLSACKDTEPALESNSAGLYTQAFLKVFKRLANNKEGVTYRSFQDEIARLLLNAQTPQIDDSGFITTAFDDQFPLTIDIIKTTTPPVSITPAIEPSVPPKKKKKKTRFIIEGKEEYLVNPDVASRGTGLEEELKVQNATVVSDSLEEKDWDRAYKLMIENAGRKIDFIEPDISTIIYTDENGVESAARALGEYIPSYPNPEKDIVDCPNPFIWHLDEDHSQLKKAREMVFPQMSYDGIPDAAGLVKIAHIDTGYLEGHIALPKFLDHGNSRSIQFLSDEEDANDTDYAIAVGEQQGHGNATLSLLAGGYLRFNNQNETFEGYFGGNPFAKVVSIKISETVVLVTGKRFAAAVDYAIEQKCDVITMSMGGFPSRTMAKAVNKAYENGIVVVSAAGNCFVKGFAKITPNTTLYPARFDRVIAAVGATCNGKPYLYDLHNPATRAAGGEFMQTCYGPESKRPTSLAAYTPNVIWFNNTESPWFVKTGGGTSSATPQIAAAASLYMQYYKKELDAIVAAKPKEKWRRVEIVRLALFESAANTGYDEVFGNGTLRAADALAIHPDSLVNRIKKSEEADGGGIFKKIFNLFRNRSLDTEVANKLNDKLKEMLSVELSQLMYRDIKLAEHLNHIDIHDKNLDIEKYAGLDDLIQAVRDSGKASNFLLNALTMDKKDDTRAVGGKKRRNFIQSKRGSIKISSGGYAFGNSVLDQPLGAHPNTWMDEIELEDTGDANRGIEDQILVLNHSYEENGLQVGMLVGNEVDGKIIYNWVFQNPGDNPASRGIGDSFSMGGNSFVISPLVVGANGTRGIFKGKLFLKIVKWIFPKKFASGNVDKDALLKSLIDTEYGLFGFDVIQNDGSGKDWHALGDEHVAGLKAAAKPILILLPGLLSNIEKGFDEFLSNGKVLEKIGHDYHPLVIGLNMPTLLESVEQNATELNKRLAALGLDGKEVAVLARSHGVLVARYMMEILQSNLVYKKFIFMGGPNQGTRMASSENWSRLLNGITNFSGIVFGTSAPVIPAILSFVKAIANKLLDLPGINDQEESSPLLALMNSRQVDTANYHGIITDYEPTGFFKKIIDQVVFDKLIFDRQKNDILVPNSGSFFLNPNISTSIKLILANQFIVGSEEQTNHFGYLKNANVIDWIIGKL